MCLIADLSAHFALWTVSKEAAPFRGKYLSVNWDVDELMEMKDRFVREMAPWGVAGISGWPYTTN